VLVMLLYEGGGGCAPSHGRQNRYINGDKRKLALLFVKPMGRRPLPAVWDFT
jgi:hypothetical protein